MSEFGKTVIVDSRVGYGDYSTIKEASDKLNPALPGGLNGGTIIVESGTYTIASSSDTITVPSNVTIIGRGGAEIKVKSTDTGGVSAFFAEDEENITISGFKIVIEDTAPSAEHTYDRHLIYMKNVQNSTFSKLYITLDSSSTDGVDELGTAIYLEGERVTAA